MPTRGRPVRKDLASAQKDRILAAAGRVFTECGYERATTKAIAAAAGVSEGALYYHFSGKRDLLLGVLDRLLGNQQARPEVPRGVSFRTFYAATIRARIQRMQPWVSTLFALMSDVLCDRELAQHTYRTVLLPMIERFEQLIGQAIEAGEVRALDVRLTARLAMVLGLGIDLLYLMGDEAIRAEIDDSGDSLADTLSTVFLDGIATGQKP